ncbi:hypothetical protein [Streptomyces sp. NPDC002346]
MKTLVREICYQNKDGVRWSRVIRGELFEFDVYHPWIDDRGTRHAGKMIVSRAIGGGDWDTVRVSVTR